MKTQKPLLISSEQFAEMLQISSRTLWRLLSSGKLLTPIHIGGSTRWRLEQVHQWIEEGCPEPTSGNN